VLVGVPLIEATAVREGLVVAVKVILPEALLLAVLVVEAVSVPVTEAVLEEEAEGV